MSLTFSQRFIIEHGIHAYKIQKLKSVYKYVQNVLDITRSIYTTDHSS